MLKMEVGVGILWCRFLNHAMRRVQLTKLATKLSLR